MSSTKPIDTPSAVNARLSSVLSPQSEAEKEYMFQVPYASAVGSLMYAMVCTRLALAHTISVVSRFMGQPGKEHWQAVQRIFHYLRGTFDVGLVYGNFTECLVTGYSDSDYAGDVDNRRSMTGYMFTLGGSIVSWKETLQPTITLSTTEAAKEGIWLRGLVGDLAKDQVHHERTKHIDVRYHFLRGEQRVKVMKIGTADNPTNMLTKPDPQGMKEKFGYVWQY
ncbi:secreted RxLR effector protein 161-like [Benincasa hispida]|uniref:secreted RxLR effector protein 161-like n=1 Tax=Benincasa hispida TaxID=102211 RepID=UPI001901982A|nr:secreted RxLR effector protein 161-like [Benincasa hispida]